MAAGFTRMILFTGVSINQPIRLKMHISRYELDGCLNYAQRLNVINLLSLCFDNKRCRMLVVGGKQSKILSYYTQYLVIIKITKTMLKTLPLYFCTHSAPACSKTKASPGSCFSPRSSSKLYNNQKEATSPISYSSTW